MFWWDNSRDVARARRTTRCVKTVLLLLGRAVTDSDLAGYNYNNFAGYRISG